MLQTRLGQVIQAIAMEPTTQVKATLMPKETGKTTWGSVPLISVRGQPHLDWPSGGLVFT